MNAPSAELSYRRTAVQEASPAGLVVILYDLLIDDLRRAIQAMRCGDIEDRSKQLKHGLLVLQIIESGLNLEHGGDAAQNLAAFYAYMRQQILNAQFQSDVSVLERQVALILDVRQAWCAIDAQALSNAVLPSGTLSADLAEKLPPPETSQWSA